MIDDDFGCSGIGGSANVGIAGVGPRSIAAGNAPSSLLTPFFLATLVSARSSTPSGGCSGSPIAGGDGEPDGGSSDASDGTGSVGDDGLDLGIGGRGPAHRG